MAGTPLALDGLRAVLRRLRAQAINRKMSVWFGITLIARRANSEKDRVRGLLIKLVAAGEVEVDQAPDGIYWRYVG